LACSSRNSPQDFFDRDYQTFVRGDLVKSQDQAHRDRLRESSPEWAWKFKILEAQSLLWRGMYEQVLKLLDSGMGRPSDEGLIIEMLAIEGVAQARLHQFPEAERNLAEGKQMCQISRDTHCGDLVRAQGVLAVQQGRIDSAKQSFEQSLQFARAHNDHFLEETSLLNLGSTSLLEGRFDEAIDWINAAYQASAALEARGEAQAALGNLGWAYYNLGDSEKSLDLSLRAEAGAAQVGDAVDELYWTTNVGYVYASLGDFARAKGAYQKALDVATRIRGTEGIYNALRALALVSVEGGQLEEADKYADEAIAIAQADNNRLGELYPLLVKGLVAVRLHKAAEAEDVFREVEQDGDSNAQLKWRSEHGLAGLYEEESRPRDADHYYRSALSTFEETRSSLQRNESKLPFSNNAARIYDDYVHFLVTQGKTEEALRWADNSRARTLSEGLGVLSTHVSSNRAMHGERKVAKFEPPVLNARATAYHAKGVILYYWLGGKQSYLWAITPREIKLFTLPEGPKIEARVQHYRQALAGPMDVLESANEDGQWLYRTLIGPAQSLLPKNTRVFIIPYGNLNNLNFETLIVSDPVVHYWIEDAVITDSSSLRLLSASYSNKKKHNRRRMLLIGNSIAPNDQYPALPNAQAQMESVARHFTDTQRQILSGAEATPAAYLASHPEQFSHIHFVAHGTASRLSPLDSAIVLSENPAETDSFKLYARDIIRHPLQADIVTISACYGAGDRAYSGEGLVGLAWAFLRAGAHNVIAGLWEVTDASTEQMMDRFYDELDKGLGPDVALRVAKLSLLHGSAFRNPFYWASFQLYVGS
jgi:CHAT domain-containing protein